MAEQHLELTEALGKAAAQASEAALDPGKIRARDLLAKLQELDKTVDPVSVGVAAGIWSALDVIYEAAEDGGLAGLVDYGLILRRYWTPEAADVIEGYLDD